MKRLPLVSVVTPVLNRRALIERCLRSVSAQSYGAIEHIVVDGGSTDGTVDAIASFQSDKDLRWISRADGGMYEAVNRGLSMARGEIVAYINSDDVYLPWSVEAAVEGLRNGVDLVFGDLGVLIRGTGRPGFSLQFYPRFDLRYYTYEATLAQPTVFFRRGLLDALGPFDTSYGLLGDCEYWLRAGAAGAAFRHIDEVLAIQVEHAGTLRATRPHTLAEEFARLRATYGRVAGPAGSRIVPRLLRRLRWRGEVLRFLIASRSSLSSRWPMFTTFLRRNGLRARPGYLLWHLLPGRLRPPTIPLIDAERLEEVLWGDAAMEVGRG